jgi:hypothetical protein
MPYTGTWRRGSTFTMRACALGADKFIAVECSRGARVKNERLLAMNTDERADFIAALSKTAARAAPSFCGFAENPVRGWSGFARCASGSGQVLNAESKAPRNPAMSVLWLVDSVAGRS